MNRLAPLAWPAYTVAALLVVIPLSETLASVWPLQPGGTSWRFGAAGLLSRALMTPLLAVLLVFATATLLEHRRTVRVLGWLMGLVAVALIAVSALFVLDTVQMRAQVRPEMKPAFDAAAAFALGKYALAVAASLIFCLSGRRSLRAVRTSPVAAAPRHPAHAPPVLTRPA